MFPTLADRKDSGYTIRSLARDPVRHAREHCCRERTRTSESRIPGGLRRHQVKPGQARRRWASSGGEEVGRETERGAIETLTGSGARPPFGTQVQRDGMRAQRPWLGSQVPGRWTEAWPPSRLGFADAAGGKEPTGGRRGHARASQTRNDQVCPGPLGTEGPHRQRLRGSGSEPARNPASCTPSAGSIGGGRRRAGRGRRAARRGWAGASVVGPHGDGGELEELARESVDIATLSPTTVDRSQLDTPRSTGFRPQSGMGAISEALRTTAGRGEVGPTRKALRRHRAPRPEG